MRSIRVNPGRLYLSDRLISAMHDAGSGLRVTVQRSRSALLLVAGGEVDARNATIWERLLREVGAATAAPGPLVVDTSRLEFMGCCAFAALLEESARCHSRGIQLRLVDTQRTTARVVAAVRRRGELPLYSTIDAALGGDGENARITTAEQPDSPSGDAHVSRPATTRWEASCR